MRNEEPHLDAARPVAQQTVKLQRGPKRSIWLIKTGEHNPWRNLALEARLVEYVAEGLADAILYLWQNQDTVVIGRNQNVWKECLVAQLEAEGGFLARRSTGGGAVFHDLGNLNFSIIQPRRTFSIDRNFTLLLEAVRAVGIAAERSGRNDLTADGRKFSGNAFSLKRDVGLHHGTLLVDSDFQRVARYLTVSPAKLNAKGVSSVRSRIVNLRDLVPELTVTNLSSAVEQAFLESLQASSDRVCRLAAADFSSDPRLEQLFDHYRSWDWRFGESLRFDAEVEHRFDWGLVQIGLQVQGGIVRSVQIFSDALDSDLISALPDQLTGKRFHSADLSAALRGYRPYDGGFMTPHAQMLGDLAWLLACQNW